MNPWPPERLTTANELLEWSRTLEDHGLSFDAWRRRQEDIESCIAENEYANVHTFR